MHCSQAICHGENGPPKIGSPRNQFFEKYGPPGTYFTAKFGPPLKHLDPLPEICQNYFFEKYGPPWNLGHCNESTLFLISRPPFAGIARMLTPLLRPHDH